MKKMISVIICAVMLIFALVACRSGNPEIEDYVWKMRTVMHMEESKIVYDATDSESITATEAKIIEMTLVANEGKLTFTDVTNGKKYEGTYTVSGRNPKGTDYHITIDGKSGYGGVAMTTYADGSEEPTLPISLDGYSMYFYAESK